MAGRWSKSMPGGFTRFGPANETGLARSDQTGSMRMLLPRAWTFANRAAGRIGAIFSLLLAGRAIGIASGHALAHILLDSVLRKGISKAVFRQSLHSRYRFGHILRRQGHQHLVVEHAAITPLGEARDGKGGLAGGKRASPAVGAGALSHDAPIEFLVARPLQSIDEVHHGARRRIEESDVGRVEPAGGERRHGQRFVSPVLDAVHRGLVSACVLER